MTDERTGQSEDHSGANSRQRAIDAYGERITGTLG